MANGQWGKLAVGQIARPWVGAARLRVAAREVGLIDVEYVDGINGVPAGKLTKVLASDVCYQVEDFEPPKPRAPGYHYEARRPWVFTEDGQKKLLETLGVARQCLKVSGAVMVEKLIGAGDSWNSLAVIDRLCELGYLRRIQQDRDVPGQHQVLVAGDKEFP